MDSIKLHINKMEDDIKVRKEDIEALKESLSNMETISLLLRQL